MRTHTVTPPPTTRPTHRPATRRRWQVAAPWVAGLWAVTYLGVAGLHLLRDTSAPWVPSPASVLGGLSASTVSVVIVVLAALGLTGLGMRRPLPRAAAAVLVVTGLVVALVVADVRTLTLLGYLPMLVLGWWGVGPVSEVQLADLLPSVASLGHSVGGLGLLLAGLAAPGRDASPRWSAVTAARIGRWAVAVAVVVPASYAVTRLAWFFGVPLGVREEFLVELGDARWAGFGLAVGALVGCLLTLGLVQRWGEVFWSWLPRIGGRPVPVLMAVGPAVFVGTVVLSAGLAFWRPLLTGHLAAIPGAKQDWAAWAPELPWPIWGAALVVAALAYRRRRTASEEAGA